MTTTPFFHPSTIDIVHAAEHNRVRAEHGLPPRLHGRRSVRDEHGPIVWESRSREFAAARARRVFKEFFPEGLGKQHRA